MPGSEVLKIICHSTWFKEAHRQHGWEVSKIITTIATICRMLTICLTLTGFYIYYVINSHINISHSNDLGLMPTFYNKNNCDQSL